MQITLELPEDLARQLGDDAQGLSRAALEGLALEGLRAGKLTKAQARRLLGIPSRHEMDRFLKDHGHTLPMTREDVEHDTANALRFSE